MSLISEGYSQKIQDLINATFQFHVMMNYCDEAVSYYGTIDLYSESIL